MTQERRIAPRKVVKTTVATFAVLAMVSPALAQQGTPAPGTFLGAVLISDDASAASQFYAAIFGWDMEQAKDGGFAVRHKGRMIAGISQLDESDQDVEESFWLVGITVDDIDASLGAARKGDAKIYEDAHRVSKYGQFAVIADRQNAPVLLIEPGVEPLGRGRDHGSWIWAELWTNDVDDAAVFYENVIGVGYDTVDRDGEKYRVFTSREEPRAGIIEIPAELETVEPGWAPYIAVSDIAAALSKVKEFGGGVVFGETEHPATGSIALIMDPSGAVVFIYEIGSAEEAK